jgi:predicted ester cyclase
VSEGEIVTVRLRITGTHEGDFMGLAPTGRQVDAQSMDLVRIRDGKAVAHWGLTDTRTMMEQLGAIPEEARAG